MSFLDSMMHQLRVDLDGALLASAIWRDPDAPMASFVPPPDAVRRFDRFTNELGELLKDTGFPPLGGYYMLALEQDRMVVVIVSGDVRWGMLIDTRRTTLGVLLSVAVPNAQAELSRLTATKLREDELP